MYTAHYLTGYGDSTLPNYSPITIICNRQNKIVDAPDGLEFLRGRKLLTAKRWLRRKWATNAAFREGVWGKLTNCQPLTNLPL